MNDRWNLRRVRSLATLCTLLAPLLLGAQSVPPSVQARLEPDTVWIGDRFTLAVEVEQDIVQEVVFPQFGRRLSPEGELELAGEEPIDTLSKEGRRLRLLKRYHLASFEEGRFNLGRIAVGYLDKNIRDTIFNADSLILTVLTFEIDTARSTIHDIKPPVRMPFRVGEVSGYVAWALAGAALLAAALFALVRWLRRRGSLNPFRPKPPVPPHVAAIRALEELHNQKLWQNNRQKLYYTRLGDILRTYIHARYGVRAMEMTSHETLEALAAESMPPKSAADLSSILSTADLVKFAKWAPSPEENENAYYGAYYFVEETKTTEPDEADQTQPTKPETV